MPSTAAKERVEIGATTEGAEVLLDPHEQATKRLFEAVNFPAEKEQEISSRLRNMTDYALSRTADPQTRRQLQMYLDIELYSLFGKAGDPPPEGIILTGSIHNPEISYSPEAGFCGECANAAQEKLDYFEQNLIRGDCESFFRNEMYPNIESALKEYLATSPTGEFIESLATTITGATTGAAGSLAKQTNLKYDIERKYQVSLDDPTGLTQGERLLLGKGAPAAIDMAEKTMRRQDAQRRFQRLAQMLEHDGKDTRPSRQSEPGKSAATALERILEIARRGNAIGPNDMFNVTGLSPDGRLGVDTNNAQGEHVLQLLFKASSLLSPLDHPSNQLRNWNYLFLDAFCTEAFIHKDDDSSFQEVLDKASLRAAYFIMSRRLTRLRTRDDELGNRRMPAPVIQHRDAYTPRAIEHRQWHTVQANQSPEDSVEFWSQEEAIKNRNLVLGEILLGSKDGITRLMQSMDSSTLAAFETPGANEEIQILLNEGFVGRPNIPGYILTSAKNTSRGAVYGFAKDPEGDPYARATMPVPKQALAELAEKYDSIGLHTLADALRNSQDISVAQLVSLISGETYYHQPTSAKKLRLPKTFKPADLKDFEPIIKNKKLWAQCTGSAAFLALSLKFCGFDAGVTSGIVVDFEHHNITKREHAQTYLNFNGKRYLLDATGSSEDQRRMTKVASTTRSIAVRGLRALRGLGRKQAASPPPIAHGPVVLKESVAEGGTIMPQPSKAEKTAELEETLRRIVRSLEDNLMPHFEAGNREQFIATLAKQNYEARVALGDPVFRALRVATLAQDNITDTKPLVGLSQYLTDYLENPKLVVSNGIPQYPPGIVSTTLHHINRMKSAMDSFRTTP